VSAPAGADGDGTSAPEGAAEESAGASSEGADKADEDRVQASVMPPPISGDPWSTIPPPGSRSDDAGN
jgi:hypothetical protein